MGSYYLGIDIGASSGRHILGHLNEGKLILEEVHRFENKLEVNGEELTWDLENLFNEIKIGMKKCKALGKIPNSVGIDTWAVDYVLLDQNDSVLGPTYAYRDNRTKGMDEHVYKIIHEEKLYERTGIQKQSFNTIYQLMSIKVKHKEYLFDAKSMLMIPDYFHFRLSGVKKTEYTNATTTQLVSPNTKKWDLDLIEQLGLKREIFQELVLPGSILGSLTKEVEEEVGFNCQVIVPATHDTASAVIAVPTIDDDSIYISSGTWSLMGIERLQADCREVSRIHNFTNEGGYDYRFRYLKNIMGLWMIQSAKKEFQKDYTYDELIRLASQESISSVVSCNDDRFLAPKSMIEEIKSYCSETNQQVPQTDSEIASVIYHSLAQYYASTVKEIEALTGRKFSQINIVGGGANADYLNQLTRSKTNLKVFAGPTEATAIGNLIVQMISQKEIKDLLEARKCILESFLIKEY